MAKMTEKSLSEAFAGESQAHMRYLNFSQAAEKEGFSNVGKLFKAIAFAEQVHASNHLKTLAGVGKTVENLQGAIEGETFENEEMYPVYDAIAKLQGQSEAQKSIHYALEAEKIHAGMYKDAKNAVESGKDIAIESVYICSVCGYTTLDAAPEKCPVCSAPKEKFIKF